VADYLRLGFQPDSPVQNPERLYRVPALMVLTVVAFLASTALLFLDFPEMRDVFSPNLLPGKGG